MKYQRGVIAVLYLWIAGGLAATFLGLTWGVHYYKNDRDTIQAEYTGYKATVKAEGEKAEAEKQAIIAKSKMENANVQNRVDTLAVANQRLLADAQAARARRGYLPPVSVSTSGTNLPTCFDRAKLDAALSGFGTEVAGLIGEGTGAVILRDGWREWFDAQSKVNPEKK